MSASTTETELLATGAVARTAATGQRDVAIDSMRGVAILMVIGIHSLQQPLDSALAKAIDAALRPAVPLFLFASGFLTARTRHVPLARRLKAVLIPYTIAFLAAYLYMTVHNPAMDHRPWIALTRFALGYVFVYYYVPVYIGCTLVLWSIFRLHDRASPDADRRLGIVLGLAILFGCVAGSYLDPLLSRLGAPDNLIEEARLRDLPFWFAFMALGVLSGMLDAARPLARMIPLLAASTTAAYAIYAATRIFVLGDSAAYDSVALYLFAALLCLMFLALPVRSVGLSLVGSGSYFIYLWHIFPIMLLRDHGAWLEIAGPLAPAVTYVTAVVASVVALLIIRTVFPPRAVQWLGA